MTLWACAGVGGLAGFVLGMALGMFVMAVGYGRERRGA